VFGLLFGAWNAEIDYLFTKNGQTVFAHLKRKALPGDAAFWRIQRELER
jgi:hypothetical protein